MRFPLLNFTVFKGDVSAGEVLLMVLSAQQVGRTLLAGVVLLAAIRQDHILNELINALTGTAVLFLADPV